MVRQAISVNAIVVGLCALLPVPFLDDLLRRAMMRGAYQAIAQAEGRPLPEEDLVALTRAPPLRVLGCLGALVLYPIKKFFRKIFYVLTIKDALDWAAEAAVRGEMLRQALHRGAVPGQGARVRQAMDQAWTGAGGSPVTRTLLLQGAEALDWRDEEGALVPVVRPLAERGAAVAVLRRFHAALEAPENDRGPDRSIGAAGGSGAENGS